MIQNNPFVIYGYESEEYFCDRVEETRQMLQLLTQTGNVLLTAQRRIGKTGLIEHCFHQEEICGHYHTFLIDIYATKKLNEFVYLFGKSVMDVLRTQGETVWCRFLTFLSSLRPNVTFDAMGIPSWGIEIGDIKTPQVTLQEIFSYLEQADKPCIVAFDEFQTIASYPEKNIEALLRTHIQHSKNVRFIFSGSQRHLLAEMFNSAARPFYQSTVQMTLQPIVLSHYIDFARHHFQSFGKAILPATVETVYQRFDGITWYVQYMLNVLFTMTSEKDVCTPDRVESAIDTVISQMDYSMSSLIFQLPSKQKELLWALCREGKTQNLTAKKFLNKYKLTASMVQAAIKGLLEKDYVSCELGTYFVYDKFLAEWMLRKMG